VIVEILAQPSRAYRLLGIAHGRGDDAHVDRHRIDATDPHEGALGESAQETGLDLEVHVDDVFEEQRPSVGLLEGAEMYPVAVLRAEQLRRGARVGEA
jgi:hypothetical protein